MTTLEQIQNVRAAWPALKTADAKQKQSALIAMADALTDATDAILAANREDLDAARGRITEVMMDRLRLAPSRIRDMAAGILQVAYLPDPVGRVLTSVERPNGLRIERISIPIGVIGIIYESRPNVTSDAAALCIQSGNACVLRSGRDAWRSSNAIVQALKSGLVRAGLPADLIALVEDTSHESARVMMTAVGLIDLLIPRGGAGLIRACVEQARVPCIETGTGICHVYVDRSADPEMALRIIENAKTSRPSVCNAEEVCLVHADIAPTFLPMLRQRLVDDRARAGKVPVELRLDARAAAIIEGAPAGDADFDTEFLDYILAVGIVDGVEAAVGHIARHSTHHSDAIVAADEQAQAFFVENVDSAAVYVNASTRFTDGGEFGLGCEMGISTQRLHARGPMGLQELTTYKYVVHGVGQIRA